VPHGWSRFHEFCTADLNAGRVIISQACASSTAVGPISGPNWELLRGLIASVVYGGQIDTAADMQILEAYITRVLHPRVFSGSTALPGTSTVLSSLIGAGGASRGTAGGVLTSARALVDALPNVDTPATFGLAANVDRAELEAFAMATVGQMRSLAAQSATGVSGQMGAGGAGWQAQLAPLLALWKSLLASDDAIQEAHQASQPGGLKRKVFHSHFFSSSLKVTHR
jgi:hypothetical protein